MAYLTREQIESAQDIPTESVYVTEWGGEVLLRGLTGTERDAYEASIVEMRGEQRRFKFQNMRARLVSLCLIDEDGNRLFPNDTAALSLGKKSAKALDVLFDHARKLSGLSEDDLEELAEDFVDALNVEDGSDSPDI